MAFYYDPKLRDFVWQTDVQQHIKMHTTPVLNQDHFRFRSDTGGVDATPTWIANEDTNVTLQRDDVFRLRIGIQESAGGDTTSNLEFKLQASYNSGTYFDVTSTSDYVRSSTSASSSADGTAITTGRLTGLTGNLATGSTYEDDGTQATNVATITANDHFEIEFGLVITSAATNNVSNNDTLDFQIVEVNGSALDAYNATPRVTADVPQNFTLTADQQSYTLTGQANAFSRATAILADSQSYTLTGRVAALNVTRPADAGSFTLSGQDVQFSTAASIIADSQTYTLTGQDAIRSITKAADSGSFTLSGQSATLNAIALVYPNADDTDGGWTNESDSNVNLYQSIDENPASDADYIKSSADPVNDEVIVGLGNPATTPDLTAGNEPTIRYRFYKTGTGTINLTFTLYEGTGGGRVSRATWNENGVGGTVSEGSYQLTAGEAAAVTNWNDLYLGASANNP